jgi:CheY-like chemotaxis protein
VIGSRVAGSALARAPEVAVEAGGSAGTILLVEDEEMVRCLIREVLSEHGYSVLEASGAEEALDRLAEHQDPIELLVTDVIRPGMAGNTLARRLASERPDLRVLYISGYTESHLTQRGVLPPGERLLQKPFTADELLQAVEAAIDTAPGSGSGSESLVASAH